MKSPKDGGKPNEKIVFKIHINKNLTQLTYK
jgi:hypothetical protein